MYEYVGKLMGVSLRNKMYLPFAMADIVYKQLLGKELSYLDLKNIDLHFYESIDAVRNCKNKDNEMDEDIFTDIFGSILFEVKGSDGESVSLNT